MILQTAAETPLLCKDFYKIIFPADASLTETSEPQRGDKGTGQAKIR